MHSEEGRKTLSFDYENILMLLFKWLEISLHENWYQNVSHQTTFAHNVVKSNDIILAH